MTDPEKYNKAMNQLLESNEYGLGNYDDRKMMNNKKNLNINNKESMGMGENMSKITDVNKSVEMPGMEGKEEQ